MIVSCLYAASSLGHFPRKTRSRVLRLGGKRPMEFNEAAFPSKRRMLIFNDTDLANGSKKNGEQYEKTVLQESSLLLHHESMCCTAQRRMISLEDDISMSRKGKGKMTVQEEKHVNKSDEMGPQTPSPSKWKSKDDVLNHFEKKVESACYNTRRRRLELDGTSLPCKKRSSMSKEINMVNMKFKETFIGHQNEDGRENNMVILGLETNGKRVKMVHEVKRVNKTEVVGPQTPSPTKRAKRTKEEENMLIYVSNKVEKAYYYTRSLKNLVINELTRVQEVSNQARTDTDQHPNPIGQVMGDRRVFSFKGLTKKKKKIRKFDLNVGREAMKKWHVLLSAVPRVKVDGIWPEVMFIVKVGKIQGPRLYMPWKGSVLDSVIGALLTQRVSDDSSSSAFMSLSMKFQQDPARDLYSRHHRILRTKRSNACSDFNSAHKTRMRFDEMTGRKSKKDKIPKEKGKSDWKKLREECIKNEESVRDADKVDSVDWHAVVRSDVDNIAEAILVRGMNQKLAIRIKDFLNRLVLDQGNLDLEWLRKVQPQDAKDFLLSIYGIGLKSTECVRLLTLRQPAFPVDVNVARVTVRLGWVPAPSVSDDIQMSLLEQYQLHCHMITFGKVFCTKQKPNCGECPLRLECRYYSNLADRPSPCVQEKDIEDMGNSRRTVTKDKAVMSILESERTNCKGKESDIDTLPDDCIEAPKTPVKVPLSRGQSVTLKKNTTVKARQSRGSRTRTEHFIYELPDLHPFLETFDDRDPDDPSPYLLVTWETDLTKPGETSVNKSPSINCVRGPRSVPGTIMVFADWQTSQIPFDIPVRTLEGIPRKQLYCGSSLTHIVKG
ncbi:hypothetical protein KSS87_015427 [Heliosperma pusillum]|nr:hypothetical protein KSS87_015427 [Heliosperma pusillum]